MIGVNAFDGIGKHLVRRARKVGRSREATFLAGVRIRSLGESCHSLPGLND